MNIVKHIKDKNNNYVATFVAIPNADDKNVDIGWSKCHRLDKEKNRLNKISSKRKGLDIAIARVEKGSTKLIASTLVSEMLNFIERISKYYKDKNIIAPAGITRSADILQGKTNEYSTAILQRDG